MLPVACKRVACNDYKICVDARKEEQKVERETFSKQRDDGVGGENGQFIIEPTPSISEILNIQIFDRWGNMVLDESHVIGSFKWDGTYNGTLIEQGVYIVSINFETTTGRNIREIFDVTVAR